MALLLFQQDLHSGLHPSFLPSFSQAPWRSCEQQSRGTECRAEQQGGSPKPASWYGSRPTGRQAHRCKVTAGVGTRVALRAHTWGLDGGQMRLLHGQEAQAKPEG